jgi:hypothetical protein
MIDEERKKEKLRLWLENAVDESKLSCAGRKDRNQQMT